MRSLTCALANSTLLSLLVFISAFINTVWGTQNDQTKKFETVYFERVFPALTFTQPTAMVQEPNNNERFYVIEKAGRIYYFENRLDVKQKQLYLDISEHHVDESFEGGLLGIAFDPDFEKNRYVYLSYTTSDEPHIDNTHHIVSHISRFTANDNNTKIITDSEQILLTLPQPWNNHNGGQISFGPDGYLYAGFGDGGSWGDPKRNAQNTHTLLGSMLRIDVRTSGDDSEKQPPYKIPLDNPFASSPECNSAEGCPEIFAWGMRNPWRWSFDRETGQLWVGDVGQGAWEEIDLVVNGANYGWNCYEGEADYRLKDCDKELEYTMPIIDYSHMPSDTSRDGMAASVTGGYVYRGQAVPELYGSYLYADYVYGIIWVLPDPYTKQPESIQLFDTDVFIVSFAEDQQGELYFLNLMEDGGIYRFFSTTSR